MVDIILRSFGAIVANLVHWYICLIFSVVILTVAKQSVKVHGPLIVLFHQILTPSVLRNKPDILGTGRCTRQDQI